MREAPCGRYLGHMVCLASPAQLCGRLCNIIHHRAVPSGTSREKAIAQRLPLALVCIDRHEPTVYPADRRVPQRLSPRGQHVQGDITRIDQGHPAQL